MVKSVWKQEVVCIIWAFMIPISV